MIFCRKWFNPSRSPRITWIEERQKETEEYPKNFSWGRFWLRLGFSCTETQRRRRADHSLRLWLRTLVGSSAMPSAPQAKLLANFTLPILSSWKLVSYLWSSLLNNKQFQTFKKTHPPTLGQSSRYRVVKIQIRYSKVSRRNNHLVELVCIIKALWDVECNSFYIDWWCVHLQGSTLSLLFSVNENPRL